MKINIETININIKIPFTVITVIAFTVITVIAFIAYVGDKI